MAAANAPIKIEEAFTLPSIGINPQFITSTHVTMESDKYICVRETTAPQNSVVVIDMSMPNQPLRRPITADSALMNPNSRILALKANLPGTTQDHLQIFNIEMKAKMKSHSMSEQIVFWKWVTPKMLGLVTQTSVYHWSLEGDSEPVKMFDRTANLASNQIINYRCDPSEKWLILIGIALGSPERPQLLKGNMQLFSVDQRRSQAIEAHAASFATFEVPGNENPSTLICIASKTLNAGQVTSKLHVVELSARPGKPAFTKVKADLLFPPDFADDFPVAMQISHKYGLIYVITQLGLLFVYDLETATAVYQNRISPDPVVLTSEASSVGGFYAVNRRGQVLLATVNEATIVAFVSGQLNNLELAVNLAKRGNLPVAENLEKEERLDGDADEDERRAKSKSFEKEERLDGDADEDERRAKSKSFVEPSGTSFRGEVPQKLERMNQQSMQRSNARLYSVEMLMQELAFVKAERYSFDEIAAFTSNFDNEIGSGAFGNVYKGQFSNSTEVAVKVLKMYDFVHLSFLTEIRTMGKTDHQNLIKLVGFCLEENMLALVYEYMENGSLDMILYKKPLTLEWDKLYAIAVELANALAYLHHDCGDQIIHHDIKASNVLLDSNYLPKLSDFGLANLKDMERTHLTLTNGRGTPGYAAPEIWTPFSPITSKCDVYSFGMILFEILGTEKNKRTNIWFPSQVWEKFNSGTLDDLMTECGISEKDRKKAMILSLVALWCAQHTPQTRPSMSTVATVLKNEILVKRPPNPFLPSDSSYPMQPA